MSSTRPRTTMIALGLAAVAAGFTAVYVGSSGGQAATRPVATSAVYVATRDIPTGTPGSKVVADGFAVRKQIPSAAIAPDAVRLPQQLTGVVTSEAVYAGEQLTVRRLAVARGNPTLAGLRGRTRAITLAADPAQLLAGVVREGDRVDVVASIVYPPGSSTRFTRVVLRGLLVVRAPDADSAAGAAVTATLAVTDAQAQKLFHVVKNAEWSLILRPGVRAADSPLGNETAATVLGGAS